MSIYLAGAASGSAHPLFTQRGLSGLTHARLDQIGLFGRPFSRELAYDGYARNIDVFIAATNHQARISTNVDAAELFLGKVESFIALPSPKVAICPIKKMSSDQVDMMMMKLGPEEPSKVVRGANTFIVLAKPEPRKAMIYTRISQDNVMVPDDTWSPATYASYCFCLVVVTEYLKTNTYPAFISETIQATDADFGDFMHTDDTESPESPEEYPVKRVRTEPADQDVEMTEGAEEDTAMPDLYIYTWKSLRGAVLVAKPSPIPIGYNTGSPAEVPDLPGRAFPYFDRMNIPENTTVRSIISTYFLRNLGDTREGQMLQFKLFKKGWEIMCRTELGGVMSHLLTGVRLSLETQTRMFAVFKQDQYSGFVLLGANWSVSLNNQVYVAQSSEELRVEINKMSSHAYAVERIAQELSLCQMKIGVAQGPPTAITGVDLRTAQQLWNAIRDRVIEKDTREKITEVLGLVSYSRNYRQIDAKNISWMFASIAESPMPDLPEGSPLYIPSTFELFHEKTFQYLCTFGPNAPSLFNGSGTVFKIPADAEKDPNNQLIEGKKNVKFLPHILVALKSVKAAHDDLMSVLKNKQIRIDLAERAGKHRNVTIGGEGRDLLYEEIRKCLWSEARAAKRKAAEDIGKSPKRGRHADIDTADDILNLLG